MSALRATILLSAINEVERTGTPTRASNLRTGSVPTSDIKYDNINKHTSKQKEKKISLLKAASRLAEVVEVGTFLLLISASQPAAKVSYQPPTPISELCTFIGRHEHTEHTAKTYALLTAATPHVGQAPQAIRVTVAVTPEHVIGSRDHGPHGTSRRTDGARRNARRSALGPPCKAAPAPPASPHRNLPYQLATVPRWSSSRNTINLKAS
ncbi:unnamed protein product [Pieris macdunnoughi]|uniref:Uncharacterized protein n=1 Tax=Pieris macdunnoughi TaxID=345717 RepID=A0A821Q3R7_9NEOP|nr:unnamed protein product [Pieris macdunnoughi]